MYQYKAIVTRVVDGDTFDCTIDLGFRIYTKQRIRVSNLNTPETWRPKSESERKHGIQATVRAKELVEGKQIILDSEYSGIYDRWSARVTLEDGRLYADVMISEGFEKLEIYD